MDMKLSTTIWLALGALGTLAGLGATKALRARAGKGDPLRLIERCDDLSRQLQSRLETRRAA